MGVLDGGVGSVGEEVEGDEICIASEGPHAVVGSGIALDELELAGAGRSESKTSGWIQLFKHSDLAAEQARVVPLDSIGAIERVQGNGQDLPSNGGELDLRAHPVEHGEFAVRGEVLDVDVKALGAVRILAPGQEVARGSKRHAPHRRVAPVEFGIQIQEDPVRHGVGEDLGCVGSDWRIGDVDLDETRVACAGCQHGQEPGVSDASGRAEFPREHLRGGKPE